MIIIIIKPICLLSFALYRYATAVGLFVKRRVWKLLIHVFTRIKTEGEFKNVLDNNFQSNSSFLFNTNKVFFFLINSMRRRKGKKRRGLIGRWEINVSILLEVISKEGGWCCCYTTLLRALWYIYSPSPAERRGFKICCSVYIHGAHGGLLGVDEWRWINRILGIWIFLLYVCINFSCTKGLKTICLL